MSALSAQPTPPQHDLPGRLPGTIWVLGLVSLSMDISSEMIHSLLPLFMATTLGSSMLAIGAVEGFAEATAAISKVFSGAFSDWLGRRKLPLLLGYGLAACTKPLFPLANSMGWVFAGRFLDRIGKGIRGAPRDALVADITPPRLRGAAYGLRQALDSIGACLGPMLAVLFMLLLAGDTRKAMWAATLPAVLAVGLLALFLREPERPEAARGRTSVTLAATRELPRQYWLVVGLGALFTLARFSEAFLVLRASQAGLALQFVPVVMIVMNFSYAAGAYPAGTTADRFSRRALLLAGLAVLILADLVLATATSPLPVLAGAALWGLHMALTQGLLAKLVADTAPPTLYGTAFGIFNLASGGSLLAASILAGGLWSIYGPAATFLAGALFAALSAAGLIVYGAKARPRSQGKIDKIDSQHFQPVDKEKGLRLPCSCRSRINRRPA